MGITDTKMKVSNAGRSHPFLTRVDETSNLRTVPGTSKTRWPAADPPQAGRKVVGSAGEA